MPGHVVFVGLMGAGKTTVGRLVADGLGRALRDCDAAVEARTGLTAAAYAEEHGIDALHDREAEALLDALAETEPLAITAAASTIESKPCREALSSAYVVWLRTDPSTLAGRASSGRHRPLHDDVVAQLRQQADKRTELFASVADLALDVTEAAPESLAAQVMSRIS